MLCIRKSNIIRALFVVATALALAHIFNEAIFKKNDTVASRKMSMFNVGNDTKVPEGIIRNSDEYLPSVDSICLDGSKIRGHPTTGKVFSVIPFHESLRGEKGVVFAVEDTVSEKADRNMPVLSREDEISKARRDGKIYYGEKHEVKIEQLSSTPPNLVYAGGHAFLASVMTAFARHLPLVLGPDQIWSVISFGFAQHVDQNSEELREHFVCHEGKKALLVVVRPGFGKTPEEWQNKVFPSFSQQIREFIGGDTHDAIAGSFTTTSHVARAAHEVALMSAMKKYFDFGMATMCGISKITLLGTEADWVKLRDRTEALGSKMTAEFRDLWLPRLLPVLDQFVAAYKGDVHHGFWQSMVKMRHFTARGSGPSSADYITGWLQILFPYLSDGNLNTDMKHWQECYWEGPRVRDFPPTISSAPVEWDEKGLHFHAGITGFTQDRADGAIRPVLGWRITHDPDKEPERRIVDYERRIRDLQKGMTGDDSDKLNEERILRLRNAIHETEALMETEERDWS